jgi:ribonuclease HI
MSRIYTDAGMNKITGDEAWGCVVNENGFDLIETNLHLLKDMKISNKKLPCGYRFVIQSKFNDVSSQQNNGGELQALVAGLRIAIQNGVKEVCTDSDLLYKWWSLGKVNGKTWNKMDILKQGFIQDLVDLRKNFESKGGNLVKISGNINKADLGLHRG